LVSIEVAVEALAFPTLTLHVLHEAERTCSHDFVFGIARVLLQSVGAVDAVPRRGESIQRRRVGLREAEDDGIGIRRLDGEDVRIERASRRQHALRRIDYAIVGSLHVGRGHRRTIVKLHISAQLESKGQSIWRGRPGFGDVGLNPHVLPVADIFEQSRVVRADGVQDTKRGAGMTVVVGRLGDYGEIEHPTTLGCLCRHDARERRDDESRGYSDLSNSLDGSQLAESMHDESSRRRRRFFWTVGSRCYWFAPPL
jgi:hypothetical protein